ncbi:hypothetical protein C8F04DRAFT_1175401 [Mycena alexandri]|uniref:Uncharacterized protein n=1 Tax=Mycena alexandri TaxID=1745969 RepID=A0AAD6TBR0_9AGAR|nr:hypothetical protein C8F04DRAFT_1175401 [Mycena alexandri]
MSDKELFRKKYTKEQLSKWKRQDSQKSYRMKGSNSDAEVPSRPSPQPPLLTASPRLRAEAKNDEERIKLEQMNRRERDANNRESLASIAAAATYWNHYKPLLNEFNHYRIPGVRIEVPKDEQKPREDMEGTIFWED